ncbi:leucine--tRNA ligase [Chamaesiphon minutus]|uniref:Leucine--tRNA ligase n=1 Tax=Chamaesiphon minutus (strain ATCC 27169 / PCC 6605) TaxID=1173020 RepID=K9UK87_CHAP6|nr:leucine--tRNA ligase [Chamaesiphon minutus]AFY94841.1 leucyl-tRNA synthetase [Chamaesiphon minutus PCC 6605]
MENTYNPAEIESKWQQSWTEQNLYKTDITSSKPKYYALSMFPYPSGNLHMGHVRNYVITDVVARQKRMQGHRVLHPMGWDAFGLPAENAAIERGIHPATWTYQNIAHMRGQLQKLGLSIDWDREVATCSPEYYRWTQWIFLKFYEGGLAYQKDGMVNWDPIDQTVLANEQVDSEGRSWRSGAIVEKKALKQWYFKITEYAEQLLTDLEQLSGWPEKVRIMQANWIGKSIGANLEFPIVGTSEKIAVFTTRPDTVYGVSYVVLAPEHPLTAQVTTSEQKAAVDAFVEEIKSQSEIDRTAEDKPKRGVATGAMAINPFTGAEVPIWIADYVLYEYGTGAVMGVPAHDVRDFKFAKQYQLPINQVIAAPDRDSSEPLAAAYTDAGTMINSNQFDGLDSVTAKQSIIEYAEQQGYGNGKIQYRLRDWLISRQRYWGVPIPIVHCPKCGAVPVPEADLPVKLPEDVEFTGKGGNPLAQLESWVNVPCPTCGTPAKRETDTMDTFVDSSWYFLRYPDAGNDKQIFDPNITNDWMPVDQYVGGIEHAVLHLLYARFFTKIVRDFGAGDKGKTSGALRSGSPTMEVRQDKFLNFDEPFKKLLTQGMVQATTYKNPQTGKYISQNTIFDVNNPIDPTTGDRLEVSFEKMSKSKYNGIDPEEVLGKYGADTARMFILFKAPPEKDLEWDEADVEGQFRFLNRMWRLAIGYKPTTANTGELSKSEKDLRRFVHHAIQAITEDLDGDYQFNTAISELMKLSNAITDADCKDSPVYADAIETLMLLAAPFAPHMTEELWQLTGHSGSIHEQAWRQFDPAALEADEITLVIQIMGKTRGTIQVPATKDSATLEAYARESAITKKFAEGKEIKKVIVVPGKLVNFIIG